MKRKILASTVALFGALALGCGDDGDDKKDTGGNGDTDAGTGGEVKNVDLVLVPITADNASAFINVPHKVTLLDSDTGEALDPPFEEQTGTDGSIRLPIRRGVNAAIYIEGVGPEGGDKSTYDSMVLNVNPDSGDTLLRISGASTASLAGQTAGFTAQADRAALSGAVYWTPGGTRRMGPVGCAKLYIDGAEAPDEDQAQRYIGANPLPATLAVQDKTTPVRGQFYFGNIKPGKHTLKVSLDDGETFIATSEFFIPFVRSEAKSPTKAILYQLGIDVNEAANPTPADCK